MRPLLAINKIEAGGVWLNLIDMGGFMIPSLGGDFLQWLRGFYYVARTGSLSAAAAEVGLNQPAISHHIKSLERELGVTLFDTSQARRELTPEGEVLLAKAIDIFQTIQETKQELGKLGRELSGPITLAATHGVQLFFLPRFITKFREAHPGVSFTLISADRSGILDNVRAATADLGIAPPTQPPAGLEFIPLFTTQPMLIAPLESPLAKRQSPELENIAAEPFIAFSGDTSLGRQVKDIFAREGLALREVQALNNIVLIKKYVALGLGAAIIDDFALEPEDEDRLAIRSLDRFIPGRTYGIVERRRRYHPPALKAFREMLLMGDQSAGGRRSPNK
jgi:DNA-binding transcriptional LysR family regulator